MKKNTLLILMALCVYAVNAQINFGWEGAVSSGDFLSTTETVGDITLTTSTDDGLSFTNFGGWLNTSGNVVNTDPTSLVTFTFDKPVNVISILPIEVSTTATVDYTFTPSPLGGANVPVTVSMAGGSAPDVVVALNWINVTSFTVTSTSAVSMGFDDVSVSPVSSQENFGWEGAVSSGDFLSTTETVGDITLTTSTDDGLSFTNFGGWLNTSGNVANTDPTSLVTFTFDKPVNVISILPIEVSTTATVDYTFTPSPLGGANVPVTVSMAGGSAPDVVVALNWINVTSFTVTSTSAVSMGFDDVSVSPVSSQENFGWEGAVSSGDFLSTTETVGDITLTTSTDDGLSFTNFGGWLNTSGNVANTDPTSLVTFTFDKPVNVISILPIEVSTTATVDYTFTPSPLGGANVPVTVSMAGGSAPDVVVTLNWINVTSFTVTSTSAVSMGFDDVSLFGFGSTLSVPNALEVQKALVYPNPVESILTIKNVSEIRLIVLYNNLGQPVLQSKEKSIDVSNLSKGLYFVQIHTDAGRETKRIIKK